jgi:hypothetical protein
MLGLHHQAGPFEGGQRRFQLFFGFSPDTDLHQPLGFHYRGFERIQVLFCSRIHGRINPRRLRQ